MRTARRNKSCARGHYAWDIENIRRIEGDPAVNAPASFFGCNRRHKRLIVLVCGLLIRRTSGRARFFAATETNWFLEQVAPMQTLVDLFELTARTPVSSAPTAEKSAAAEKGHDWNGSTSESSPGVSIESWRRARGWSTEEDGK